MTLTSLVSEGTHVDKLGKLLVSETETIEVWGKDIHAGKVHPKLGQDGQPTEVYWCPPEAHIPTCKAFMQCKCVQPIFVMTNEKTR